MHLARWFSYVESSFLVLFKSRTSRSLSAHDLPESIDFLMGFLTIKYKTSRSFSAHDLPERIDFLMGIFWLSHVAMTLLWYQQRFTMQYSPDVVRIFDFVIQALKIRFVQFIFKLLTWTICPSQLLTDFPSNKNSKDWTMFLWHSQSSTIIIWVKAF